LPALEQNYLRKKFSYWIFQKILKGLWHDIRFRITLLISLIALVVSFSRDDNIFKRRDLEKEKANLERRLLRDSLELQAIRDTLAALERNDPFLLEKYAREKYNMKKEGETVYKFVEKEKK